MSHVCEIFPPEPGEHELFPALGKVSDVTDLLLSCSSFSGLLQCSLKHAKISIQLKPGGTRCWSLELSFTPFQYLAPNCSWLSFSSS